MKVIFEGCDLAPQAQVASGLIGSALEISFFQS
jgi:hypothetical protein